eukprot:278105_1
MDTQPGSQRQKHGGVPVDSDSKEEERPVDVGNFNGQDALPFPSAEPAWYYSPNALVNGCAGSTNCNTGIPNVSGSNGQGALPTQFASAESWYISPNSVLNGCSGLTNCNTGIPSVSGNNSMDTQ